MAVRGFRYKNYSRNAHNHDFFEMNIVLGGTGVHIIENVRVNVRMGDVFVIPPNIVHAYCDSSSLEVYHIIFLKSFIDGNREEASKIPGFIKLFEIEPSLRQKLSEACFLHLTSNQLYKIESELEFIEDKGAIDTKKLLPLKYHTVWKILYYLSFLFDQQQSGNSNPKHSDAILRTMEYIHLNYASKITVDLLCKISLLSRSSLYRSFLDVCGCTPMDYVNRYRCKKALEMLDSGECSKTEAAHSCGFYDLSHMERTIRRFSPV